MQRNLFYSAVFTVSQSEFRREIAIPPRDFITTQLLRSRRTRLPWLDKRGSK